jgi:Chaperone of endosialidase
MRNFRFVYFSIVALFVVFLAEGPGVAQTTTFTYQGRLQNGGTAATGSYDFQFTLWDAFTGGTQQPQPTPVTQAVNGVAVASGLFSVDLNFGAAAFTGASRYLEVSVSPAGSGNFVTLTPRQSLDSTPYAIRSLNSTLADQAKTVQSPLQLGGSATLGNGVISANNFADDGVGVLGTAFGGSGRIFGVWGYYNGLSTGGVGVAGDVSQSNTGGTGVKGTALHGIGVLGQTDDGRAVEGVANQAGGYAGYFFGRSYFNGNVGIGTSAPVAALDVSGNSRFTGAVGIGTSSPSAPLDVLPAGGKDVLVGGGGLTGSEVKLTNGGTTHFSIYNSGDNNLTFANTSTSSTPNNAGTKLVVVTSAGSMGIGTTSPTAQLTVNAGGEALYAHSTSGYGLHARSENTDAAYFEGSTHFTRWITLDELKTGGNSNFLCLNPSNQISSCSSSLRYKTNVQSYNGGFNIIERLRPITFDWKEGGAHDVGLAAEEVMQVDPLFAFRNDKGQVEGVRYSQLSAVFINAFKEQQTQIEQQQKQLEQQRAEIELLKQFVCADKPAATICKPQDLRER